MEHLTGLASSRSHFEKCFLQTPNNMSLFQHDLYPPQVGRCCVDERKDFIQLFRGHVTKCSGSIIYLVIDVQHFWRPSDYYYWVSPSQWLDEEEKEDNSVASATINIEISVTESLSYGRYLNYLAFWKITFTNHHGLLC